MKNAFCMLLWLMYIIPYVILDWFENMKFFCHKWSYFCHKYNMVIHRTIWYREFFMLYKKIIKHKKQCIVIFLDMSSNTKHKCYIGAVFCQWCNYGVKSFVQKVKDVFFSSSFFKLYLTLIWSLNTKFI